MAEVDGHRYLCSQLVTLNWPAGTTTGNLEEIQADGCMVESDVEVTAGEAVEMRCDAAFFAGTVTRADEHEFGWRISVEFSPLTPWSIEHFRPEHLFDPAGMLKQAGIT